MPASQPGESWPPGRSLGMFPAAFIVTAIWTVSLVFVYSLGTLARLCARRRPEITAPLEKSTELPASDRREAAVQDMREVSIHLSLTQNDMDEIFGREDRPGSGTLASLISPNTPPHETQPPGAQPGEDIRNDSELTEPLSEALARDLQMMDVTDSPPKVASSTRRSIALLTRELLKTDANREYCWASQDLPATCLAANSTGAHFDTTATLKLFELLRGVREQVQIALWDIQVAIPEVSPRQAQELLDKMKDELERLA